jgi:hypothetical protein
MALSASERDFLLFRLALSSDDDPATGCRIWTGGVNSKGYGTISVQGHNLYVHRVAYVLVCAPLPQGKLVCHTCDNRRCIAAQHLVVGTAQDNYEDMRMKGNAYAFGHRVLPRELVMLVGEV